MRTTLVLSIVLLAAVPTRGNSDNSGPRVLLLEGSAYEQGLTHGRTLKNEIHDVVRLWKADLAAQFKMDADAFIARFLGRTHHVEAIKKWTPELLDEVRGIADGSGTGFDTMLAFQLVDEYWATGSASPASIAAPSASPDARAVPRSSHRTWIWRGSDRASRSSPLQSKTSGFTFECSIMVLGNQPELHFSPGPPDTTPFHVLTFPARAR